METTKQIEDLISEFQYDLKIMMGEIRYFTQPIKQRDCFYVQIWIQIPNAYKEFRESYVSLINATVQTANRCYADFFIPYYNNTLPQFFVNGSNITINYFKVSEETISYVEEFLSSFISFYRENKNNFLRRIKNGNV